MQNRMELTFLSRAQNEAFARVAVAAFVDAYGKVERPDILRAMNRVSSMLYILMIRLKKEDPD